MNRQGGKRKEGKISELTPKVNKDQPNLLNNYFRANKHLAAAQQLKKDAQNVISQKKKLQKTHYDNIIANLGETITHLVYLKHEEGWDTMPNRRAADILNGIGFDLEMSPRQESELEKMRDEGRFENVAKSLVDTRKELMEMRLKGLI